MRAERMHAGSSIRAEPMHTGVALRAERMHAGCSMRAERMDACQLDSVYQGEAAAVLSVFGLQQLGPLAPQVRVLCTHTHTHKHTHTHTHACCSQLQANVLGTQLWRYGHVCVCMRVSRVQAGPGRVVSMSVCGWQASGCVVAITCGGTGTALERIRRGETP